MQKLSVEETKQLKKDMVEMAKDFIKYGETYSFFKTYDYPQFAIEQIGEEALKKCWKRAYEDMCQE